VKRIHATQFWETALSSLAGFMECGNGFDLRMGASTLDGEGRGRESVERGEEEGHRRDDDGEARV
jgi:hypothetical protein